MQNHSTFIIFDGPSASGKNTLIDALVGSFTKQTKQFFTFEEVTSEGYDGQAILTAQEIGRKHGTHGDRETTQAFIAQRKKLYARLVFPQLMHQEMVIANRGEPSTLAYQTIHGEITMEEVWHLHRENGIPIPSLVFITHCSVDEALRREQARLPVTKASGSSLQGKFSTSILPSDKKKQERQAIHDQYWKVSRFLQSKGVVVVDIDTQQGNVAKEVEQVMEAIGRL